MMADEGFKRKPTAILSADVVGFSRIMENNEEATNQTLNTHRQQIIHAKSLDILYSIRKKFGSIKYRYCKRI